jgi:long-chain acyl-CoA synthetase
LFLDLEEKNNDLTAIIDSLGYKVTYGEIIEFCREFYSHINKRTLVFVVCENCAGALSGYVAAMNSKIVPLMLSGNMDRDLIDGLIEEYKPEYLWVPENRKGEFESELVFDKYGYALLRINEEAPIMYDDLSMLLTTSGSTGSPKLVRHNYENVRTNAKNISAVFKLNENENGMVSLPLQFTQGLNVAYSHLYSGSTVLLSTDTIAQGQFWSFFEENKATSFTGVPYSYEVLDKLRFFRMDLPHLKTINEGGGRLSNELFMKCAEYAVNTKRKFIATYGATETTSRMAYLPPELAISKCGSIGVPLPDATMKLVDEDNIEINDIGIVGEIVYTGENVTLGYAQCLEDLQKGDERGGVYHTGDMAKCDEDGCYFIVGRKKRFLKLYGYRISLDECERMIKGHFEIDCACVGTDKRLSIYITDESARKDVLDFVSVKTKLVVAAFDVNVIPAIPKNDAGKINYNTLQMSLGGNQ